MRLVRTAVQVAILALAPSLAALAESGDGGAQQAGGAFMTSYPPAATAPTRAAPPRRRGPQPHIAARSRRPRAHLAVRGGAAAGNCRGGWVLESSLRPVRGASVALAVTCALRAGSRAT